VIVVDASALLALLRREPGAGQVEAQAAEAVVSAVNLSEVWSRLLDYVPSDVERCRAVLDRLRLRIIPFDETAALAAARLRPITKAYGLSLGDRACLALALARGLPVLTADRQWADLDIGVEVRLIR
jgi:ribonuclease VapC